MGTAATFTAIFDDQGLPTEANAREFYRSIMGSSTGSGVVDGGGSADLTTQPFIATADTTAIVPLGEGRGWCSGIFGQWNAGNAGTHADRHATLARIDYICMEADYVANTMELVILTGTAAATPVPPTVTQNAATLWQEPILEVAIDAGAGAPTIVAADVTRRTKPVGRNPYFLSTFTGAQVVAAGNAYPVPVNTAGYTIDPWRMFDVDVSTSEVTFPLNGRVRIMCRWHTQGASLSWRRLAVEYVRAGVVLSTRTLISTQNADADFELAGFASFGVWATDSIRLVVKEDAGANGYTSQYLTWELDYVSGPS